METRLSFTKSTKSYRRSSLATLLAWGMFTRRIVRRHLSGVHLRNRQKLLPFVPGHFARTGNASATYRQAPPQRRGKSGVVVPDKSRFEISVATKARVLVVRWCFDLT